MTTANAAVSALQAAARNGPDVSGSERARLLGSAKRIAYNAAADVWPGWDLATPSRSDEELRAAQVLAETCKDLTERLDRPACERGNAVWLIGAFDLALGDFQRAAGRFQSAESAFADDPEASLMARGYRAMALARSGVAHAEVPDLDAVIDELNSLATEDAHSFSEQLRVARSVFITSIR